MKMYIIMKDYDNDGSYEDHNIGYDITVAISTSIDKARDFVASILNTNEYTQTDVIREYDFKIIDTELCGVDEISHDGDLILAHRKYCNEADEMYQDECTFNETFYIREFEVIE